MNTFMDRVNVIVQKSQAPINQMTAAPNVSYPDTGMGALENVANGVPRQTMISNQPHMLAYINPQEEQALRDMGGSGLPGPGGIPAYDHGGFHWNDTSTYNLDSIGQSISDTASNVGSSIRDTASNVYDTVSTVLTDTGREIITGGDATTGTYNNTTSQDDIDKTVAANAGSSFNNGLITGADGNTISVGTNVNADTFTDNTITTGVGTPGVGTQSVVFPADEPLVPLSDVDFSANVTLDNGQSIPVTQYVDGTVAYFPDGAGGQSFSSRAAVNQYLGIGTAGTDTTTIETSPIETNPIETKDTTSATDITTGALATVGTAIPTFANYYDAIDAGYLNKEVIINGQNVIAETADGYTGAGEVATGTGALPAGDTTTTGTGALPAGDTTTTGSNTFLQNLTNIVTFAGNKSYVNGVEITVNNAGQTFANWVDGKDNLEYQDNVLYDLTTGLPVVGTEAEDAFFNTGYDETTGTYENQDAAATSDSFIGPMPNYQDINGVVHNSQEEADEADREIGRIAAAAVITPTDERIARENGIHIRRARPNAAAIYFDRSGNPHASLQEALDSNATLVVTDAGSVTTEAAGALPAANVNMTGQNTMREVFANLFTIGDSAFYEGGTLYGYDKDGKVIDLTGGGETFDRLTGLSNYVYGVSDDPNSGAAIDTTGMTQDEKNVAIAKKQMLYDIPPSDLAYFASFLPNLMMPQGIVGEIAQVASFFGGGIGDSMLKGGIEDRRAIVNQEAAALEAGATPIFNEAGEYTGHDTSTMMTFADKVLASDDVMKFMPPSSTSTDYTVTQADIDEINRINQEYGGENSTSINSLVDLKAGNSGDATSDDYSDIFVQSDGSSLKVGDVISTGDFTNDASQADADGDGVDDSKRFETVFNVQSTAAAADPTGMSTEDGFITSEGTEYFINGDGSVQEVVDGVIKYEEAESGESVESVYGLEDDEEDIVITSPSDDGSDRAAVAASIFKRYYRGGSGAGLPAWLQKYASGKNINQLLEKVTVEGEVYYKTTDKPPRYIKEIELAGAVEGDVEEPSADNEE